jgi:hypothetical protein
MGVALVAAGLAMAAPARAQYMPVPVGAARMPEPQPAGPSCDPPPNLIPGPISPTTAPMGPPDNLSLPCDHSSAFQCEEFAGESHWYLSAGGQWLQRQKLGAGVIAVNEPDRSVALELNNLTQTMNGGPRYTIGYMWANCAVEYTGFYIPEEDKTATAIRTGRLDALFANPPPALQDASGLSIFFQGNRVSETFGSHFWDNEVNFRTWNLSIQGADLIAGPRYIEEGETLTINMEPNRDRFASIRSVTNQVRTVNRMALFQLGSEYSCHLLPWLAVGATCKGGWGANFLVTDETMMRGDGLQVVSTHNDRTVFTQVYDIGLFVDFYLMDRLRLRGGYNTLWLLGVATAPDQLDLNMRGGAFQAQGPLDTRGSIFWHGPMVELQFLF